MAISRRAARTHLDYWCLGRVGLHPTHPEPALKGAILVLTRTVPWSRTRAALAVVCLLAAVPVLQSCSDEKDERTVENFCATYADQKKEFLARYESIDPNATDGTTVLTNLILGIQSLGDVTLIFQALDKVAPDDIEPDVAAVLKSWEGMQSTLGDEAENAFNPGGMIGAMLKGLLMSIQSNGSWTRLGQYITDNCDA